MTPSLAVQFSAAADGRQVNIDEDCVLRSVMSGSGTTAVIAIVSLDPKTTAANAITSPSNTADENIIAITRGTEVNPNFPLSAGQSVFVSASGASSIMLGFQLNR